MCTVWLVLAMRATTVSGPGRLYPCCCRYSVYVDTAPCTAATFHVLPSYRFINPNLASQMRTALASMESQTGSSSPGELEITRSTSEVAGCLSNDSVNSSVGW